MTSIAINNPNATPTRIERYTNIFVSRLINLIDLVLSSVPSLMLILLSLFLSFSNVRDFKSKVFSPPCESFSSTVKTIQIIKKAICSGISFLISSVHSLKLKSAFILFMIPSGHFRGSFFHFPNQGIIFKDRATF